MDVDVDVDVKQNTFEGRKIPANAIRDLADAKTFMVEFFLFQLVMRSILWHCGFQIGQFCESNRMLNDDEWIQDYIIHLNVRTYGKESLIVPIKIPTT